MNSLIKAIKNNTERRKKIKRRIDSEINLSVGKRDSDEYTALLSARSGGTNRLIDEGAIIEGDGSVWGYVQKGTLKKFMNGENIYLENLPDDFVGYINIGHHDHATFPFPVGEWRKEDMSLVDIGDGRQGIDMNNSTIDRDSVFIKELERLGLDVSESVEATFHLNVEASEDLGFPVFDEILIYGYAVVGDGKNVNSNGLQLKGENSMSKEKDVLMTETVDIEVETENVDEVIEEIEKIEETIAEDVAPEEEVVESEEEEPEEAEEEVELSADEEEEVSEDEEIEEESDEEDEVEEVVEEEVDGDEDEVEEEDALEEALSVVNELKTQVAELSNTVEELRKKNKRLSKKLAAEKEAKADFLAKTKELSVELLPNELEEEKAKADEIARLEAEKKYKYGDGIADI